MDFKKKEPMVTVSIRLPKHLIEIAKANKINISRHARHYLERDLKRMKKVPIIDDETLK
jgi:post-segregation antitoxin (ccd killing protein)